MRILGYKRLLLVAAGAGLAALLMLACSPQAPLITTTTGPVAVQEGLAVEQQGTRPITTEAFAAPANVKVEAGETASTAFLVQEAAVTDGIVAKPSGAAQVSAAYAETGIRASGRGQASAAPDLATLNLGVEATDDTVSEARNAAAGAMTAVLDAVKADGVAGSDIQTGRFNIRPRYTYRQVTRCVEAESEVSGTDAATGDPIAQDCYEEGQEIITGYRVTNNVTVLVRDLDMVDDVIDGAVEAGGDLIRFNGLRFSLEDTAELEKEARSAAVANLNDRASQLAELSKVSLGDLTYLGEIGYDSPGVFRAEFGLTAQAAYDSGGLSTPISGGEVAVEVSVQGKFAIEPLESETATN